MLGTRLRTRMLWGAVLVSLVPLVFMFFFSYLLMNRAVERWFSQPARRCATSPTLVANITKYATDNAHAEAESIAISLSTSTAHRP